MPVVITSVNGAGPFSAGPGGSQIPTWLQVRGTFSGCTDVWVGSTCTTPPTGAPGYAATLTGGSWSCDLPNDKKCACGAEVTVSARCDGHAPVFFPVSRLACDCPSASNGRYTVDPNCFLDQGVLKRNVHLEVTITNPTGAYADAQW